jgi:hypothetical protein
MESLIQDQGFHDFLEHPPTSQPTSLLTAATRDSLNTGGNGNRKGNHKTTSVNQPVEYFASGGSLFDCRLVPFSAAVSNW